MSIEAPKSRFSVDPKSKYGLPPKEEIDAEIQARVLKRAIARQERGLPITHNVFRSICRDELSRFLDDHLRRWLASLPN